MNATELVNYIESSVFCLQTYRIDSNVLKIIRQCIREIYTKLLESGEDDVSANYLRLELLKLQSSPSIPPLEILSNCRLDNRKRTERIWGADIANVCITLDKAIQVLAIHGSPLLIKMVEVVSEEIKLCGHEKIKIWCHRKEKEEFVDLFLNNNIELTDSQFISSLAEYRQTDLFEVLVRLGPLRSRGWTRTPKSIISAPRYKKLLQFVWSGSFNDSEFGNDPVLPNTNYLDIFSRKEAMIESIIEFDDIHVADDYDEVDDFVFLAEKPIKSRDETKCVMIELPGSKGVLLSTNSHQLVFDHDVDSYSIVYKDAHEIKSDDCLLLHDDIEADLGGSGLDNKGIISPLWKQALHDIYHSQYQLLISRMRTSGIDLLDLDRAAKTWMQTDGEVIHGPQTKRHFQLLIQKVLPDCLGKHSWKQAWSEIESSRVKAIQHGRIENTIVNEQLVKELENSIDSNTELCEDGNFFRQNIDPASGLTGTVKFYPVLDVSPGFNAPHDKLRTITRTADLEVYRIDI